MAGLDYDKLTDPILEILETSKMLLMGAMGPLMGDQREGLNLIYANAGGLYTLFMDVITALGIEKMSRRAYLPARFDSLLNPMIDRSRSLLDEVDGPLLEEQVVAVDFIYATARLLRVFTDELWQYARILNHQVQLNAQPVQLDSVLDPLAWPTAHDSIELSLEVQANLPPAYVDADALNQCLHHLVANAIAATEAGRITVQVARLGDSIEIQVTDSGNGMETTELDRLFEPFTQVTPDSEGLGLGLFIVKSLVTLQRGTVHMTSEQGVGSTVRLTLPVAPMTDI